MGVAASLPASLPLRPQSLAHHGWFFQAAGFHGGFVGTVPSIWNVLSSFFHLFIFGCLLVFNAEDLIQGLVLN